MSIDSRLWLKQIKITGLDILLNGNTTISIIIWLTFKLKKSLQWKYNIPDTNPNNK